MRYVPLQRVNTAMTATHDELGRLVLMTPGQLRPWSHQEHQLQDSTLGSSCTAGQSLAGATAYHGLQDSMPDTPISGLVLGDGMYGHLPQSEEQRTAEGAASTSAVRPASKTPCPVVATDAAYGSSMELHTAPSSSESSMAGEQLCSSVGSNDTAAAAASDPADGSCEELDEASSMARSDSLHGSSNSDENSEGSTGTDTDKSEERTQSLSGESSRSSTVPQVASEAGREVLEQQQAERHEQQSNKYVLQVLPNPNPTCNGLDETPHLAPGAASVLGTLATPCSIQSSKQHRKQLRGNPALTPAAVTAVATRLVSSSSSISAAANSMMGYTVQAIARLAARQHQHQHQPQLHQQLGTHTTSQQQQPDPSRALQVLQEVQSIQSPCSTYVQSQQIQLHQQNAHVHDAWQTKRDASPIKHPVQSNAQDAQQHQQPALQQQQQQLFHEMLQHVHNRYPQAIGLHKHKLQHPGLSAELHHTQQPPTLLQPSSSSLAQVVHQAPSKCTVSSVSSMYSSNSTATKGTAGSAGTVSSRLMTKQWQQIKWRQQQQQVVLAARQQQQQDEGVATRFPPQVPCLESESAIATAAAALRHAGEAAAAAMAAAGRGPKQHKHDSQQSPIRNSKCKPAHFKTQSPTAAAAPPAETVAASAGTKGAARTAAQSCPAAAAAVKVEPNVHSGIVQGRILPVVSGQHDLLQRCSSTVSSPQPSTPGSANLHLPRVAAVPANSAAKQTSSRPGSPTRVFDFSQLEGELAVVGVSSCASSRSSSPLGSRCCTRDGLHNHDASGSSGQLASSTCTATCGTSVHCTACSTRGRPAAVPRLVLPRLPSIKEKLQPSSRDATPTSAAAKALQQQCSPQQLAQISPHSLNTVMQLPTTACPAQQPVVKEQRLATLPDTQGVLAQQATTSSSSSPITALGSAAADAVVAGSPWHSNRLSTRQSNGLTLQQAAAPVGYAALSPRLYELRSSLAAAAAAAAAMVETAARATNQRQPTSIRASSAKQQIPGHKNSRKARRGNSSSSRPGSSNCQNRTSCGRLQGASGNNSLDTCSSNAHNNCSAAAGKGSSRCGSGQNMPHSKGGSSRLGSSSGSQAPSRCASASQTREYRVCNSSNSGSRVRSNSMHSRRESPSGGSVSRPGSSCNHIKNAVAHDARSKVAGSVAVRVSSSSSNCPADRTAGNCNCEAAAACLYMTAAAVAGAGSDVQLATSDLPCCNSSSSSSGKASDLAAAHVACTACEDQHSVITTSKTETHQVARAGAVHGACTAAAATAVEAVEGIGSSSSSSVQGGSNTATADIAREQLQQQQQQQQQGSVKQQQQQQQSPEQHAVHTPGLPFTLVTSVVGDSNVAAPGRHFLELQLQKLEDQSAQLAPVDLLETPKLPGGIAAAAAAAGGIIAVCGKVVTAQQAKAAAKHLLQQQQQPVVQQQASSTGGQKCQHADTAAQQHMRSKSLARLAGAKRNCKLACSAADISKSVAGVAAAVAPAAAPPPQIVEAGLLQRLIHQGGANRATAVPVCSGGAGVIVDAVESKVFAAVTPLCLLLLLAVALLPLTRQRSWMQPRVQDQLTCRIYGHELL